MGISPYAILSGLLQGAGGAATGIGNAFTRQQEEQLARDKMAIEQQRADDANRNAEAAVAAQSTPVGDFFKYLGVPLPTGIDPNARVPNAIGDNLVKAAQEQEKVKRETTGRLAQADLIRQSAQGTPAQLTGQLAQGEDPEAAAMIPRTTGAPPPANAQERLLAAGLHEKAGLGAPLLEKILGLGEDTWKPAPRGSEFMYDRYGNTRAIPGGNPTKEPPNYAYIHGSLAEAGWRPDMPGYNTEFMAQLQQPVPIQAGGKAVSRSEGIRPPSFYSSQPGAAAPGGTGQEAPTGAPQPRFSGAPAPVSDVTAHAVAQAVAVRQSTNRMYEAIKNPDIVNNYIGPYAQYWSKAQGLAPNAALGKKPPALVDLETDMANLENYTIRLITGAAVREAEEPRIRRQLPSFANQPDEFTQKLTWTINNNAVLENQIRTLALQGDANARAAMAELGLDRMREVDVTKGPRGAMDVPRAPQALPKLQPGERLEGGEIISESGQYVWRGGQWQPR